MQYTPEQLQRIYAISRNVEWRYKLDLYEDKALKTILSTLKKAMGEIETRIVAGPLTAFQADRMEALLVEFDGLTAGARLQLTNSINDVSSHAGEWAVAEHNSITSFGGLAAPFNNISLTAEQFNQFFQETPLGAKTLSKWVDAAFDSTTKAALRETINAGVLQGEGYRPLVKRVLGESYGLLEREAITLTRTYVQSANVAAQDAVYAANADIVKEWEWCATLEPGYMKTGRGTCPRCSSLDGKRFALGKGPACPLHPRCRCVKLPVTKTYKELGIDLPELEDVARPYTVRPDKSIDAGGKRTIIETGFHEGDYGTWWAKQGKAFQNNSIGIRRAELVRSGKVGFHDLTNDEGRLLRLDELA